MFVITCDVKVGAFKSVKPHSLTWKRSVTEITNTASFKIPAIAKITKEGDQYEIVQTGLQIEEGMPVELTAGYNGVNPTRFKGYVSRVNFTIPLEVECEGYSYQLRKKMNFTKSYKNTTVKKILADLIEGTDIKLSDAIPDIPLEKAVFTNATGIQVLEWFKEKCLLTVYFNFNVLYVGALEIEPKSTVKFRLGWNVIKDNELKFNNKKEFAEVRIVLEKKSKKGKKNKGASGVSGGSEKVLKSEINDQKTMNDIAEQQRKNLINRGYEGAITAFLFPYVEPGMAAHIEDLKYPERTGRYFITGDSGSVSPSGGRIKVLLGNSL